MNIVQHKKEPVYNFMGYSRARTMSNIVASEYRRRN